MKKPINNIKKIKELFVDLLFPRFCVGCGAEGNWLCKKCAGDIVPVVSQVCPKCAKLSANGEYHEECKKGIALKGIIAGAYFEEGPVREMIHNLKYNGVLELKDKLAELMVKALTENRKELKENGNRLRNLKKENGLPTSDLQFPNQFLISSNQFLISFTPLHWHRQATRGYNQSELLANHIGQKLNIPVVDALVKIKGTKRQVELTGEARRKNLRGLFRVKKLEVKRLRGKAIIIVDDVYTTGSTLNECARVLKAAGAKKVWGLVIARG